MTEKELQQIKGAMETTAQKIFNAGRQSRKAPYKETERRLRAYPILKQNIKRYEADIEDIKHEDMKRSKDIVLFTTNTGMKPDRDIEELRQQKIFRMTERLNRDRHEVDEIETALGYVKHDAYYKLIKLVYFEGRDQNEVESIMHCDRTTIWRNRKILVQKICTVLYGADAAC